MKPKYVLASEDLREVSCVRAAPSPPRILGLPNLFLKGCPDFQFTFLL